MRRPANQPGGRRSDQTTGTTAEGTRVIQPTTRDGSRPMCGRYFKASVVIMTPSHVFGVWGRQPCSYPRSSCHRSRRAALCALAHNSPRLIYSTTHRKIAGGVSCHSPRRISYVVSSFRFLRRESSLENLLVWRIQLVQRPALGVSSFSRAPAAEINCMTCSIL